MPRSIQATNQVQLPVKYKAKLMDAGYRIDLLIDDNVIVELKAVERIIGLRDAQLLSYLKLSNKKIGLLINFNVMRLKYGIKRMAN